MTDTPGLEPLQPILVADRFAGLGDELIGLLRSLDDEQWNLPTVCSRWSVRDIAAHLLDSACRRLSFGRDGLEPLPPEEPIRGYDDLVAFLDQLNARWVSAAKRLSPRLLTELLGFIEPLLAHHLVAVDPWSRALFPVAWAGEDESQAWFDVARELTERWLHQQQIRLAVGAPPLDDPRLTEPVFDTFLRALPHGYREVEAPPGASLVLRLEGRRSHAYTLERSPGAWTLFKGEARTPTARIILDEELAWLLLSKGIEPAEAESNATLEGSAGLTSPYFHLVAVMA